VSNRFTSMGIPAFPLARLLVFWGGIQQGYWGFSYNPVSYARQVRCPVLLMHGNRDPWVKQPECDAIYQALAGEKRYIHFDAGHEDYLEKDRATWIYEVTRFLN